VFVLLCFVVFCCVLRSFFGDVGVTLAVAVAVARFCAFCFSGIVYGLSNKAAMARAGHGGKCAPFTLKVVLSSDHRSCLDDGNLQTKQQQLHNPTGGWYHFRTSTASHAGFHHS
jgi:hypothetical protein